MLMSPLPSPSNTSEAFPGGDLSSVFPLDDLAVFSGGAASTLAAEALPSLSPSPSNGEASALPPLPSLPQPSPSPLGSALLSGGASTLAAEGQLADQLLGT